MGWWGPWHNGGGFSRDIGGGYQAPQSVSDNEFRGKSSVLLHRPLVAEPGQDGIVVASPEQAMRNPKSFTVLQPIPGQSPKPLFTVCASIRLAPLSRQGRGRDQATHSASH